MGRTVPDCDYSDVCLAITWSCRAARRPDGGLSMWLQNVHSSDPLHHEAESDILPVGICGTRPV